MTKHIIIILLRLWSYWNNRLFWSCLIARGSSFMDFSFELCSNIINFTFNLLLRYLFSCILYFRMILHSIYGTYSLLHLSLLLWSSNIIILIGSLCFNFLWCRSSRSTFDLLKCRFNRLFWILLNWLYFLYCFISRRCNLINSNCVHSLNTNSFFNFVETIWAKILITCFTRVEKPTRFSFVSILANITMPFITIWTNINHWHYMSFIQASSFFYDI